MGQSLVSIRGGFVLFEKDRSQTVRYQVVIPTLAAKELW